MNSRLNIKISMTSQENCTLVSCPVKITAPTMYSVFLRLHPYFKWYKSSAVSKLNLEADITSIYIY